MLRIQLNQPKPTFEQRLAQEAHRVKERAKTLPHGKERELLSLKARQRVDIVSRTPATEVGEHHAPGNSKSSPRRTPT
jgi:hypothetical protein